MLFFNTSALISKHIFRTMFKITYVEYTVDRYLCRYCNL